MALEVRARTVRRKKAPKGERPRARIWRVLEAAPVFLWRGLLWLVRWLRRAFEALERLVCPPPVSSPRVVRVAVA
jgi:hypothetical protein